MRWMYAIRYKAGAALLLTIIVLVILAGSFWERSLFTTINNSFLSIYKDRLIPAAEMFHVNDLMYHKRLLLENHLSKTVDNQSNLQAQLAVHNARIDSILAAFETTYLVDEESSALEHLKNRIDEYNRLEQQYLTEAFSDAEYEQKIIPVFEAVNHDIIQLSNIQTQVGQQLLRGSETAFGSASLVNYLQMGMVVIIALLIQALLLTSKSAVPKKPQNFHLN